MRKIFIFTCLLLIASFATADALEDLFIDTMTKAEQGDTAAMYDLAKMYAKGVGTQKDFNEALVWYQESARGGYATAAYKLGTLYDQGKKLPRDARKAFSWYKMAAELGHKKSRAKVAEMYAAGDGVEKNAEKALEWSKPPVNKEEVAKNAAEEKKAREQEQKKKQAAEKKKNATTLSKVADHEWKKRKRPALYLPSKASHCNQDGDKLSCMSKKISSQKYNQNYTYRVRSKLYNFTPDGHFDVDIQFQLVDTSTVEIEGYGQENEEAPMATAESISEELAKRSETLSCDLDRDGKTITCMNATGRRSKFNR